MVTEPSAVAPDAKSRFNYVQTNVLFRESILQDPALPRSVL
jgi:hypothetical protein